MMKADDFDQILHDVEAEREQLRQDQRVHRIRKQAGVPHKKVPTRKQRTKEAALQQELAQREMARRHLLPFVTRFHPKYLAGWVHKVFAAKLEQFSRAVERGEHPRLMIFVPPRHGKSTLVSSNYPSWILGHHPDWEIIMTSYSIDLPTRFSRDNRARIKDRRYKAIFPETELDPTSSSAIEWQTTKGGGMKCAGVGGGIGGFGANVLIIDDPIKDYEDAQSETIRETVKNWYSSTAENRLAPESGVIIVQTRWHDDDLSGWKLRMAKELREQEVSDEEIEEFEVVSFPAIAEEEEYVDPEYNIHYTPAPDRIKVRDAGDPLHSARYPLPVLKRKRANMPKQQWSALFQQNPVPDSGDFFQKEDFIYYDSVPVLHDYPVIIAGDLAIGERRHNDWTVYGAGVVVPMDGVNRIWLLDFFRGRVRDTEQIDALVNMCLKYKRNLHRVGLEYGQIFLAIERRLLAAFDKAKITPSIDRELKPIQDKRVRATPARGWMQHHRILFPRHQPWTEKARGEMLRFDAGVNDDIVDMLAWMVRMAEKMPLVQETKALNRDKTLQRRLNDAYREQLVGQNGGFMAS